MAEQTYNIEKGEGKEKVSIALTGAEVRRVAEVVKRHQLKEVFLVKGDRGAVQVFTNDRAATNCMNRHGFDFRLGVEAKDIKILLDKLPKTSK